MGKMFGTKKERKKEKKSAILGFIFNHYFLFFFCFFFIFLLSNHLGWCPITGMYNDTYEMIIQLLLLRFKMSFVNSFGHKLLRFLGQNEMRTAYWKQTFLQPKRKQDIKTDWERKDN